MSWSQQQQQQQQAEDLRSQFHLLPHIETTADAVERGAMEQHVNDLVSDLAGRFDRCQQMLNSIVTSNNSKPLTLRWQKQKVEEHETQLKIRRDLINQYKDLVEQTVNSNP